jgi:hypothetical protein
MKQNRFRSKAAWAALIVFIGCVLKTYGLFKPLGLNPESYKESTDLLMVVAGAFGIWNNPESSDQF